MSRIGKKPITIPKGVTVKVLDNAVEVKGPKGQLRQIASGRHQLRDRRRDAGRQARVGRSAVPEVSRPVAQPGGQRRAPASPTASSASSTSSASATAPKSKGKQVIFALGYSHAVVFDIPPGSTWRSRSRRTSP